MKKIRIEIEKRGALNSEEKKRLLSHLKEKGKLIGEYNQLSIFCESGSRYTGEIENTKVSISVSILKNLLSQKETFKLKAKTGKMESGSRKEIVINFSQKDFHHVIGLLEIFEINTGCPRFYHRYDYKLGEYDISVKEKGFAPDHFEIETDVFSQEEVEVENIKIDNFLFSLELNPYSDEEYKKIMLKTFSDYPPVSLKEIDLNRINS